MTDHEQNVMETVEVIERAGYRRSFNRLENEITAVLDQPEFDYIVLKPKLDSVDDLKGELVRMDRLVMAQLIQKRASNEAIDEENLEVIRLKQRISALKLRAEYLIQTSGVLKIFRGETVGASNNKDNLPNIEIQKFTGKLEDWLQWWAYFEPIHTDKEMLKAKKFRFLLQSVADGTQAKEILLARDCTPENYDEAVEALKEAFGNKQVIADMLIKDLWKLCSERKEPLTRLYTLIEGKLSSLKGLGRDTRNDSDCLYPAVESALPQDVWENWDRQRKVLQVESEKQGKQLNRLELLMEFLKEESKRATKKEQTLQVKTSAQRMAGNYSKKRKVEEMETEEPVTASGLAASSRVVSFANKRFAADKCGFCSKANHRTLDCYTAPKMTLQERRNRLSTNKMCFLCFKRGHFGHHCKSHDRCSVCKRKHHKLLCADVKDIKGIQNSANCESSHTVSNATLSTVKTLNGIPLQTLKLRIHGTEGRVKVIRTILDPGAQKSAILKSTAEELGLISKSTILLGHFLYGGAQTKYTEHRNFMASVSNLEGSYTVEMTLLDEEIIVTKVPSVSVEMLPADFKDLPISDMDAPSDIELLLGNDVYGSLLTGDLKHSSTGLTAIRTKFGWVLSGQMTCDPGQDLQMASMMSCLSIQQLWELDVLGITDPIQVKSKRELDEETKEFFLRTLTVNVEGRYEVRLPWVLPRNNVANNYDQALKRLMSTTKKLQDSSLYEIYEAVFNEWKLEHFIEDVPPEERDITCAHYLPHRAVVKMSSATTKVRPVFDASCRMTNYKSLNDCLAKGPNQLERIPTILLRFRLRKVAATADIRKAFPMISISPGDRDYLRFLWWEKDGATVKVYRHRRVVFGVNCSPFQLAAVIEHHLIADGSPNAMKLLASMYVDNCVVSLNSDTDYRDFKDDAVTIMARAKMDLRLWESNVDTWTDGLDSKSMVLGMVWDRRNDFLRPAVSSLVMPDVSTKRTILAMAHALYDPLGLFCPISLEPKLCLRDSCVAQLSWDEAVPDSIVTRIRSWSDQLKMLETVGIPRHVAHCNPGQGVWSLHVFSDASKDAYAAAAFLRVQNERTITVRLVQAKCRLSPLRSTIPRLELMGCLISARLGTSILQGLGLPIPTTFWTDSTTALTWIRKPEHWGTFINNRVNEIRKLTNVCTWRHIPTKYNPADLPSRGCTVGKLIQTAWWNGPAWLKSDPTKWPQEPLVVDSTLVDAERRKTAVSSVTVGAGAELWYLRSHSYHRNIRIFAYVLRWRKIVKRIINRNAPLDIQALNEAEKILWKLAQQEMDLIKEKLVLTENSDGLKCVKLRITERDDTAAFKMPVYLPGSHPLVEQLVLSTHLRNHHVGPRTLVVMLRERVWIPNSKKIVHRVLSKCIVCKRFGTRSFRAPEAPLPKERVQDARAFEVTGVDVAGPIYARRKNNKGTKKFWFALFTCAVYRGVHLELLSSLSTECFLLALRRFIARRSRPSILYSDNGTNFRGLYNIMNQLDWKRIQEETQLDRIEWRFNPPSAPWWGGWWERLIGNVKRVMRRVFKNRRLTRDELVTSLCDIESVINSRPLTYVSEDAGELLSLTPLHFMSDSVNMVVSDLDEVEDQFLRRRYRYRQNLRRELRERFREEYLANLKAKRELGSTLQVKVGDIVLLGSEGRKRVDWPLAKVVELIPGRDGASRLARLKLASGEAIRAVQRLYPLEVTSLSKLPEKIAGEDVTVGQSFNGHDELTEERQREYMCRVMRQKINGREFDFILQKSSGTRIEGEADLEEQPQNEQEDHPESDNATDSKAVHKTRSGRVSKGPERLICQMLKMVYLE